MTFLTQCDKYSLRTCLVVENISPFSQGVEENWLFMLCRLSIADWDMFVNTFYRTFYTTNPSI